MEDVHTAIQQSDCLVNSSTSEGMCAAILEVGTLTIFPPTPLINVLRVPLLYPRTFCN